MSTGMYYDLGREYRTSHSKEQRTRPEEEAYGRNYESPSFEKRLPCI